jgi:hypothetical protein
MAVGAAVVGTPAELVEGRDCGLGIACGKAMALVKMYADGD